MIALSLKPDVVSGHQLLPRSSQETVASPGTPAGNHMCHGASSGIFNNPQHLSITLTCPSLNLRLSGPCPSEKRGEPSGQGSTD